MLRVLVGCEHSGVVRRAFRERGHDAYSCDLLPSDDESEFHIQSDVFDAIRSMEWDLMICHPPCTHLAVSGARWFPEKRKEQAEALQFVVDLLNCGIPMICLENPVSIISSAVRDPDQIIHPWQFGHEEEKTTCLWLKNLPKLKPTKVVRKGENKLWKLPPTEDRWKLRSKTFEGIAEAMADQWGSLSKGYKRGFGIQFKTRLKGKK